MISLEVSRSSSTAMAFSCTSDISVYRHALFVIIVAENFVCCRVHEMKAPTRETGDRLAAIGRCFLSDEALHGLACVRTTVEGRRPHPSLHNSLDQPNARPTSDTVAHLSYPLALFRALPTGRCSPPISAGWNRAAEASVQTSESANSLPMLDMPG
jgi:hypothetical protein